MTKFFDRLYLVLIIAALVYFLIYSISIALTEPFSFDGALNAQAAKELVKNFTYATTYNGINKFDPSIQTGAPVIFPVALFFKLFGISFESGLFVNVIYINLLLLAIVYYLNFSLKLSKAFGFLAVLFFFAIPQLFDFGFGLYGEIPTLFYLLLALILYHYYESNTKFRYIFYAGLAIGFGYLTKSVILISLPALFFVEVLEYIFSESRNLYTQIKKTASFISGIFLPVFLFESYKLASLGGSEYLAWWKYQINAIFMQAGVKSGFSDTSGLLSKFSVHMELLSSYVRVNLTVVAIILSLLLFGFLTAIIGRIVNFSRPSSQKLRNHLLLPRSTLVLLTITLSYFGWWLLITTTQKAWYRRIFDGVILLDISMVILLAYGSSLVQWLFSRSKSQNIRPFYMGLSILFLISLFILPITSLVHTKNVNITFADSENKSAAIHAGDFINTLPADAEIYGYGWWQAPVISFTSGRSFIDLAQYITLDGYPRLKDAYLAIDSFEYTTPNLYDPILSEYAHELVFFEHNVFIYRLNSR